MFRHIIKAGMDFQDAMFDYMADFIFNKMVPDTYDYTKIFGLCKGKGSEHDQKHDEIYPWKRLGRITARSPNIRENETIDNNELTKDANRRNCR